MPYQVVVHIRENGSAHTIGSPEVADRDAAEADLNAIREKQKQSPKAGSRWIELPWLSVHASHVVSAHVTETKRHGAASF